MKKEFFFILFFALGSLFWAGGTLRAQTPTPTPAKTTDNIGGYEVKSSIEFGVRGRDINGSENKYRSDFNYKSGFRIFDSSFSLENKEKTGKLFDSLLINSSGWGADPSGFVRFNVEKIGAYRFESNVRKVIYFNNLSNHALGEHNADTDHNFGDFDLTILPQNETIRFRLGTSFNKTNGSGGFTTRAYSDEFPVTSAVNNRSNDFRGGVDAKIFGFNLSFTEGYRKFKENTSYFSTGVNLGNNLTNSARLTSFQRDYPIDGDSNYSLLTLHRTFARKLDFTGRFIYSETKTDFQLSERQTGRDNSNNIVDLDNFTASGSSKRIQKRGDFGVTYDITKDFRISDTINYDYFNINGANQFFESLARHNAAGTVALATTLTSTTAFRVTGYRRATNTIEADYQVNNILGFNVGYRFTSRRVRLQELDRNVITNVSTPGSDEFENNTNAIIAGIKVKPTKYWSVYSDVEHGAADNVFTRLANYNYTNFRVRNRVNLNKVAFNVSFVTKNNDNPSGASATLPTGFVADTKVRIFSSSIDYNPATQVSVSAGYTYQFQNSRANILIPISGAYVSGLSRYYMRDSYFFFDVSAQPFKRVSLYASFRSSNDKGQGRIVSTSLADIIGSYPYRLLSPEFRIAVRLTKNIDWNAGYQYYDFRDRLTPAQSYNAHLPYTSLRIYFGGAAGDRR